MKNWDHKIVLAVGIIVIMMGGASSFAQTPPMQTQPQQIQVQTPPPQQVQTPYAPTYGTLTYPELFALAWVGGAYKKDDPLVIDGFLRVTQCKLYNSFYTNEFEWNKIRENTKKQLEESAKKFPRYYEYVQPLYLGRYDSGMKGFPVAGDSSYEFTQLLQISKFFLEHTDCGDDLRLDPRRYPSAAVLKLLSPLSLSLVRVPEDAAKRYVEKVANIVDSHGREMRQAYVRFRIRVDSFSGIAPIGQDVMYMFKGRIEQASVFEDRDLTRILYEQTY